LAGIYIHIPFCKQACNYCNFHFVTSLRRKNELIAAIVHEIGLSINPGLFAEQTSDKTEIIDTIYFGGGTPSICTKDDMQSMIEKIYAVYKVSPSAEITIETNPDDITPEKLKEWKELGVNRLSIGIQSFFEEDLMWMNRAHNAVQSKECIEQALQAGFTNMSIDLIYGTPLLTDEKWKQNVETAIAYNIPHLSCYALTVEPKTPLQKLITEKKKEDIDNDKQARHFLLLMDWLSQSGYEHYEISNFAKPGMRSRHNSSYWSGKKYSGFGPAAHSFNGNSRKWNIANNNIYIESINKEIIPFEKEELTDTMQVNEYIMTSLRTIEGMDITKIRELLNKEVKSKNYDIMKTAEKFIVSGKMEKVNSFLKLTNEGKLMADGIAAELFLTD
jgi:oxygen-independent coproporphyrinogen III oxidase